jgi:DNA-binding IclR family transcriptional regulator
MSKIVDRTLDVFELFASEKRPLVLSDFKRLLNIPVSSCFDVIQALKRRGYLYELHARGGFYPTRRIHELGRVIAENDPFVQRAMPTLEWLRDASGETVLLASLASEDMVYVAAVESLQTIRFAGTVGARVRSMYATSAGKAYLGMLDEMARKALVARLTLKPLSPRTILSSPALLADVALGERRGWQLNREESMADCITLSTRVASDETRFALTIAGVKPRMEKRLDELARHLLAARDAIERQQ